MACLSRYTVPLTTHGQAILNRTLQSMWHRLHLKILQSMSRFQSIPPYSKKLTTWLNGIESYLLPENLIHRQFLPSPPVPEIQYERSLLMAGGWAIHRTLSNLIPSPPLPTTWDLWRRPRLLHSWLGITMGMLSTIEVMTELPTSDLNMETLSRPSFILSTIMPLHIRIAGLLKASSTI